MFLSKKYQIATTEKNIAKSENNLAFLSVTLDHPL